MKLVHLLAFAGTIYLAITGINELLPSGTISALDGLPDAGSLFGSSATSSGTNYVAAGADLAAAAALYFFVLHKELTA